MTNNKTPRSCGYCDNLMRASFGGWECRRFWCRLRSYKNNDGDRVPIMLEPCKHRR